MNNEMYNYMTFLDGQNYLSRMTLMNSFELFKKICGETYFFEKEPAVVGADKQIELNF